MFAFRASRQFAALSETLEQINAWETAHGRPLSK
jgi:hypothetical protein